MQIIADLQLHSRFSRAVSQQMTIPNIAWWAGRKGIGLVATGDWTHPLWFREIQANLEETGKGLLKLKEKLEVRSEKLDEEVRNWKLDKTHPTSPHFLLATEVSCIYSQGGKVRRIHTLVWVPTIVAADKINKEMTRQGCNLMSDGRPIIGLTSIQLAELVLSIEPKALIIPAHAWTPWFSLYGSMSGFDSIKEAFGPFAKNIYAIETGLSSDPAMNWRVKDLDNRSIISFSDAHSGPKLGREATVFELPELSYENIYKAISQNTQNTQKVRMSENQNIRKSDISESPTHRHSEFSESSEPHIAYTLEFYPEEGKYHYTGHRLCNIRQSPDETKKKGTTCPVCGKPLTVGVMHRVEDLASRNVQDLKLAKVKIEGTLVEGTRSVTFPHRPPYVMLVPLQEIIAEAVGSPVTSPKVQGPYQQLTDTFNGEFHVLLKTPISEITKLMGGKIAQGIDKVRSGDIVIEPGFDGVFGVVKIWKEGEEKPLLDSSKEQLSIF